MTGGNLLGLDLARKSCAGSNRIQAEESNGYIALLEAWRSLVGELHCKLTLT